MKQVQIPQKLFVQLIHYHLMEDDNHEGEIRIGLEKKLDALVLRELYGKSKGDTEQFPLVKFSLMI